MSQLEIETPRLRLVLESLEGTRARIESLSPEHKAQLSPAWLELLNAATTDDPWILGFEMVLRHDGTPVGQCGFKGPPTSAGVVEIAYAVEPDRQGNGFATEAAEAMTQYALQDNEVGLVCAHTLPATSASTRVLTKCGFEHVGEAIDPDDGLVWRWERTVQRVPV